MAILDVTNEGLIEIVREAGNVFGDINDLGPMGDDFVAAMQRALAAKAHADSFNLGDRIDMQELARQACGMVRR